jgi:HAD superfamily hydrolase (TIGR01509 family)
MLPFRAALIDLYDTLVEGDWSTLRAALSHRLGVDDGILREAFTITRPARNEGRYADEEADMAAVVAAAGLDPEPELVRELASLEFDFQRTGVRLHPESLGVLRELRAGGAKTALVSNCQHSTRATVDRLGLEDEMDVVVLSFELGARKPQPAIYHAALDALGADATDAVFVDDQAAYCDGASRLGIATRLILRPEADPPEGVSEANGHRVITDLRALLED